MFKLIGKSKYWWELIKISSFLLNLFLFFLMLFFLSLLFLMFFFNYLFLVSFLNFFIIIWRVFWWCDLRIFSLFFLDFMFRKRFLNLKYTKYVLLFLLFCCYKWFILLLPFYSFKLTFIFINILNILLHLCNVFTDPPIILLWVIYILSPLLLDLFQSFLEITHLPKMYKQSSGWNLLNIKLPFKLLKSLFQLLYRVQMWPVRKSNSSFKRLMPFRYFSFNNLPSVSRE